MTDRLVELPAIGAGWREDRRVMLTTGALAAGSFAVGSVVQSTYIYVAVAPGWSAVDVWSRIAANAVAVAMLLGALLAWRQHRRSRAGDLTVGILLAGLAGGVARALVQVPFGVYQGYSRSTTTAELGSGVGVGAVCAAFATWAMLSRRRVRQQALVNELLAVQRAMAVRALEDEEIRVRRDVAEGLHASVQQRLVLAVAQVAEVARTLRSGTAGEQQAQTLDEVCAGLDAVRDQDVRDVSRLLYPDQLEVGLVPAVRALLRRVPTSVATRLDIDPAVREMDDPVSPRFATTERLLAARVVEEGIGNALRHASPSSLTVSLGLDGWLLTVAVEDDGVGLPGDVVRSGTGRLAERLGVVGGTLELADVAGGTRLVARLPVTAAVRA
ncbi:MAG TPA: ATP-binding protein [Cellulomonas sp.]